MLHVDFSLASIMSGKPMQNAFIQHAQYPIPMWLCINYICIFCSSSECTAYERLLKSDHWDHRTDLMNMCRSWLLGDNNFAASKFNSTTECNDQLITRFSTAHCTHVYV